MFQGCSNPDPTGGAWGVWSGWDQVIQVAYQQPQVGNQNRKELEMDGSILRSPNRDNSGTHTPHTTAPRVIPEH